MKNIYISFLIIIMSMMVTGCIDDSISSSPSHQPSFSSDTLNMGTIYTDVQSATHRFTVYNRNDKGINISDISLSGEYADRFRLNVDGMGGKTFQNIEIRANDSIYVFVCADLPYNANPKPRPFEAYIDFTVNGVKSNVVISVNGQDVRRLKALTVVDDTWLTPGAPYQVWDSLVVAKDATLNIAPGTVILFHDNAKLTVYGSLRAEGTPAEPIKMTGDRTGNVITDVSFELMSRQWAGVDIKECSENNYIAYSEICNTVYGVRVHGNGKDVDKKALTLVNSRLTNSGDCCLAAYGASVEAYGCQISDASYASVYLAGGNHRFDQCTIANFYLFGAISRTGWIFPDLTKYDDYAEYLPTKALVTNSITYGIGPDMQPGDLTGYEIYFKRCMFRSAGTDDDNFIDTLWDSDPMFYTVRKEYLFDYRLRNDSPAIGVAYTALSEYPLSDDFYGQKRNSDLGAYVYIPGETDNQ